MYFLRSHPKWNKGVLIEVSSGEWDMDGLFCRQAWATRPFRIQCETHASGWALIINIVHRSVPTIAFHLTKMCNQIAVESRLDDNPNKWRPAFSTWSENCKGTRYIMGFISRRGCLRLLQGWPNVQTSIRHDRVMSNGEGWVWANSICTNRPNYSIEIDFDYCNSSDSCQSSFVFSIIKANTPHVK